MILIGLMSHGKIRTSSIRLHFKSSDLRVLLYFSHCTKKVRHSLSPFRTPATALRLSISAPCWEWRKVHNVGVIPLGVAEWGDGRRDDLGWGAQCVQVACGINHACWPNDLPPSSSSLWLQNADDNCDHTCIKRGSNESPVHTLKETARHIKIKWFWKGNKLIFSSMVKTRSTLLSVDLSFNANFFSVHPICISASPPPPPPQSLLTYLIVDKCCISFLSDSGCCSIVVCMWHENSTKTHLRQIVNSFEEEHLLEVRLAQICFVMENVLLAACVRGHYFSGMLLGNCRVGVWFRRLDED